MIYYRIVYDDKDGFKLPFIDDDHEGLVIFPRSLDAQIYMDKIKSKLIDKIYPEPTINYVGFWIFKFKRKKIVKVSSEYKALISRMIATMRIETVNML